MAGRNGSEKRSEGNARRVTLSDIARRLGVSSATVSLALNDKGTLPQKRRQEIKQLAADLHYVPNPVAKALRSGGTRTIGVVTNYFSNIYFRDFYTGLEEVADREGFSFMVSQSYESPDKEVRQVEKFCEYGVDGLIVLPCSGRSEHLFQASSLGIPVVLISNTLGDDFAAVVADNHAGTRMAADHLLAHYPDRPLLHIAGPDEQSCLRVRRDTFCQALVEARPDADPEAAVIQAAGLRSDEGYACMQRIMARHRPPLSLFVCNDETAMGVIRFCSENSLSLPADVAVACFSGDSTFSAMGLPVSTVAVQARRMGEETARLLLHLIDCHEARISPPIITLPVSLEGEHRQLAG